MSDFCPKLLSPSVARVHRSPANAFSLPVRTKAATDGSASNASAAVQMSKIRPLFNAFKAWGNTRRKRKKTRAGRRQTSEADRREVTKKRAAQSEHQTRVTERKQQAEAAESEQQISRSRERARDRRESQRARISDDKNVKIHVRC